MNDLKRIADALEKISENIEQGMDEGFPVKLGDLDIQIVGELKKLIEDFTALGSSTHPFNVRID